MVTTLLEDQTDTGLAYGQIFMMGTIKSRGGLTQGRGMTEPVRFLWVYGTSVLEFMKPYESTNPVI